MKKTLLCLLLCVCFAGAALADTSVDVYEMDIRVEDSGYATFEETIVYRFEESYNGILAAIWVEEGYAVGDLRLFADDGIAFTQVDDLDGQPYTFTAQREGQALQIKAFAPGGAGTRTFRLTYGISGWAQRYQDTARVNHALLYSSMRYEKATFRIALPGGDDTQIEAFAHGEAGADQLTVQGGQITIGPLTVDADEIVEVEALFPAAWLTTAPIIAQDMREEALAMEAQIAAEAAEAVAREARLARTMGIAILLALAVYAVAFLYIFLRMRAVYGLKHHVLPRLDDALLGEIPPAQAQALRDGNVTASGLSATLLSLAERGVLTMAAQGEDTCFTYARKPANLLAHETMLLDWLFEGGDTLCVSQLDAGDDESAAAAFTSAYNAWKVAVTDDVRERQWVFDNAKARLAGLLSALLIGLSLSLVLLRYGLWPIAIPGIVLTCLLTLAFGRLRRLTDEGELRLAAIYGFLQSYEDKLQTEPETVLRHVPLVMALGYLEPLATWLDHQPPQAGEAGMAGMDIPIWMFVGWHGSIQRMERGINEAQSHNAGVQSAASGGGTSGGGFSGGTGGSSHGSW